MDALFGIYDAMGDVVARSTQPALAAIKLAWWRERLEELGQISTPAEPRLQAATLELLPRGVSGSDLADLEGGWAAWLEDAPEPTAFTERGPRLFQLAARILDIQIGDEIIAPAGREFAIVAAARRGITKLLPGDAGFERLKVPVGARPLTAFTALAHRDMRTGGPPFEAEATPGRAWTLLRHRLTGRL